MGIFDRLIPRKDAPPSPTGEPSDPAATTPPESAPGAPEPPRQAPLDEATRVVNETARSLADAAKPLGEAMKPLGDSAKVHGKSFMEGVSTASRDLGGVLRDLTAPSTSASSPANSASGNSEPVGVTPTSPEIPPTPMTPMPPSSEVSNPVVEVPSVVAPPVAPSEMSAPIASEIPQQSGDAQPLPDHFNPFADAPDTIPAIPHDVPTSESWANDRSGATGPTAGETLPPVATGPSDVLNAEGHLEEYQEPLTIQGPSPLDVGTKVVLTSSAGTPVEVEITAALTARGAVNVYSAKSGDGAALTLREAAQNSEAATRLERENTARRSIDSPQIPVPTAFGVQGERVYLADAGAETEKTFAAQLEANAPLAEQIFTLTQASAALSQLHKAGFIHGALRPEAIILSRPVRLGGFESLSPLGQKSDLVASFAGYGAPEIIAGEPLDARTDVYSVGALLHRILTGQGVPETGWDDATFNPELLLPGAPQILAKTLGPPSTRYSDMSALHRDLVRLRARLRPLPRHESVGETTIGLEWGRTTNQDAWGELRGQKQGEDGSMEWTAWVVSDGMGGMASGEVASQAAVGAILHEAASWGIAFDGTLLPETEHASLVKNWTREANRQATEEMNRIGARGGCTLVCGLVIGRRLTLAHVGDCRVYLWRGGQLTQLTRDHSYVMSLVMQGEITREEMRDHPDRSKITRSLGDRHPMPDYFVDGLEVETKSPSLELQTGDILLAFSDGVWEPVLESQMGEIINCSASLQEAAHELVDAAMRAGGPDNATVYLFKLGESAPVVVSIDSQATMIQKNEDFPPLPSDRPTL